MTCFVLKKLFPRCDLPLDTVEGLMEIPQQPQQIRMNSNQGSNQGSNQASNQVSNQTTNQATNKVSAIKSGYQIYMDQANKNKITTQIMTQTTSENTTIPTNTAPSKIITKINSMARNTHKSLVNFGFMFVIYAYHTANYCIKNTDPSFPLCSFFCRALQDVTGLLEVRVIKRQKKKKLQKLQKNEKLTKRTTQNTEEELEVVTNRFLRGVAY